MPLPAVDTPASSTPAAAHATLRRSKRRQSQTPPQPSKGAPRTDERLRTKMTLSKVTMTTSPALLACFRANEDVMEVDSPTQNLLKLLAEKARKDQAKGKRLREASTTASPNKSPPSRSKECATPTSKQGAHSSAADSVPPPKLWFGFDVMEKIAINQGLEELFTGETIDDRVTRGIPRDEATELESVCISFPRVPQLLYPSERADGLLGQHLNLTQLPFEIEIDPVSHLSLDFHVAIHFQLPNTPLFHNHVKQLVNDRLSTMKIPLGTHLIEPISVLCMSSKRGGEKGVWAGIVKLHLLHPEVDGVALLKSLRPFIFNLEPHLSVGSLGKVCKSYHSFSRHNNLSIKITSETWIGMTSHAIFLEVLENSFRMGHDFEIV